MSKFAEQLARIQADQPWRVYGGPTIPRQAVGTQDEEVESEA